MHYFLTICGISIGFFFLPILIAAGNCAETTHPSLNVDRPHDAWPSWYSKTNVLRDALWTSGEMNRRGDSFDTGISFVLYLIFAMNIGIALSMGARVVTVGD